MKVSIIIPVYNNEKYLNECLNSVINQSYKNIEVILVNDGSKDDSLKICNKFKAQDSRIIIIDKKNEGVSAARNAGIKIATGEFITFCDADDIMNIDQIEFLLKGLIENNSDLAMCGYKLFDTEYKMNEKFLNDNFKEVYGDELINLIINDEIYAGYVWNKIFRLDLIKKYKIEFLKEIYMLEDEIFVLEYIKNCNKATIISHKLYGYRNNPNGAINQNLNEKTITFFMGREKIYSIIREITNNEKMISEVWNEAIKTYAIFFKKVFFSNVNNKKAWKLKIIKSYLNNRKLNVINKSWCIKERIYLIFLKTISFYYYRIKKFNFIESNFTLF